MQAIQCWVSLGSNFQPQEQLHRALTELERNFGSLKLSQAYKTQPVGIKAKQCAPFYNLAVGFYTELQPVAVNKVLKSIEADTVYLMPADASVYVRALDLDIISWGDLAGCIEGINLPYPDLLKHDFVLLPMAELAPQECPPGYAQTYADLWRTHAHPEQPMQTIDLAWQASA